MLAPIIEAEQLSQELGDPSLLIIDCSSEANFLDAHIPGAVHIKPSDLQCGIKPAVGKLPSQEQLSKLFSGVGLSPDKHVIAYDDEGGGWAGRLIWTLEVLGHKQWSYLNGGRIAWLAENRPTESGAVQAQASDYRASISQQYIAECDTVMQGLEQPDFAVWDARSAEEYRGEKVLAQRGGHIPGAVHLDWLDLMDPSNDHRLKPLAELEQQLAELGLGKDKTIATHCQSHHRSGLSWLVMKLLNYPSILAYHGSWSEWGNRDDTPIEQTH